MIIIIVSVFILIAVVITPDAPGLGFVSSVLWEERGFVVSEMEYVFLESNHQI